MKLGFLTVVRSFLRDLDVVDVGFTETAGGDLNELSLGAHFVDRLAAAVAHGGAETADHLVDDGGNGALVWDHAFDAFWNELVDVAGVVVLEVAVGGTLAHCAQRAHSAVGLVGAALVEDDFARSFFGACEHAAHHDGVGAGSDCLCDVAGEADAAVGDAWNAGADESFSDVADCGDLRNADACDDAGRTDGARADADLDAVCSVVDEGEGGCSGGDVAADDLEVWIVFLDPLDAVENAGGVAVCGVDYDDVDSGVDEAFDAVFSAGADGNGSACKQLALGVLGCERMVGCLGDVLDGHEACEAEVVGDDENAFEAVLVHELLGFLEAGAFVDGDETIARSHDFADRSGHAGFKAKVAVGDHAEDAVVGVDDWETGDAVFAGESDYVGDDHVRADGDRFADDAGFMALDLGYFESLLFSGHVLVDEADAAFLSEGDCKLGFGNGVHGGGNHWNVDAQIARQLSLENRVTWENFGVGWNEQNVVESKCLLKETHNNLRSAKKKYVDSSNPVTLNKNVHQEGLAAGVSGRDWRRAPAGFGKSLRLFADGV